MKYFIYSLTLALLFLGCNARNEHVGSRLLQLADSLDTNPQYALHYLEDSISADSLGSHDKASYYLLLTEAMDKNDLDIFPCDSILDYAIKHLSARKDPVALSKAFFYKGKLLAEIANYDLALDYYNKALNSIKDTKETALISKIHSYIGNLFLIQNLYPEAMEHYHTSYRLDSEINDKENMIISLMNIGMLKVLEMENDSALLYYHQALALIEEDDNLARYYDNLCNSLSMCYTEMGDFHSAGQWINKITTQSDDVFANKGNHFLLTQEYDSARLYLERGIESANIYSALSSYYDLAELEQQLNNYQAANKYLYEFMYLRDSIRLLSKTSEIQRIVYNNNLETQRTALRSQHNQRMIIFIAIAVLIIILMIFFFLFNTKKKKLAIAESRFIIERQKNDLVEKEDALSQNEQYLYTQSESYALIQKTLEEGAEPLKHKEQEILKNEIPIIFHNFATQLHAECSTLSRESILLCILIKKIGIPYGKSHLSMGYPKSDSIRKRKSRIKMQMMKKPDGEALFNSIFGA